MPRTWQTDEVIRRLLTDADHEEVQELLSEAGEEAVEALQEWIREGSAPKSLYDAVLRFSTNPRQAFDTVDWEYVVEGLLKEP